MKLVLCNLCGCAIGKGNYAAQHWIQFHRNYCTEGEYFESQITEYKEEAKA